MDRLLDLSRRFSDILTTIQEFLWRLLERHILKMVAFFAVWVALEEVRQRLKHQVIVLYLYFEHVTTTTQKKETKENKTVIIINHLHV